MQSCIVGDSIFMQMRGGVVPKAMPDPPARVACRPCDAHRFTLTLTLALRHSAYSHITDQQHGRKHIDIKSSDLRSGWRIDAQPDAQQAESHHDPSDDGSTLEATAAPVGTALLRWQHVIARCMNVLLLRSGLWRRICCSQQTLTWRCANLVGIVLCPWETPSACVLAENRGK